MVLHTLMRILSNLTLAILKKEQYFPTFNDFIHTNINAVTHVLAKEKPVKYVSQLQVSTNRGSDLSLVGEKNSQVLMSRKGQVRGSLESLLFS